ncbi:hypothetical protein MGH68_17145 [Erysipelothrix sp. D19-032]
MGRITGEGIIVPPSADLVDVAHRNGVPVMGTVFFPPKAYGGQNQWVSEFLVKRDDGSFPMADKLIEMAESYGFDGWFINQETSTGSPEHGQGFLDFLAYYNNNKKDHMELVWYDSMLESGQVSWQNELNDRNKRYFQNGEQRTSDYMFLNFRFGPQMVAGSRDKAISLNRSPYDVLAGFDVQARGVNSGDKLSNAVGSDNKVMTSVGLYAPDWTLRDGGQYNVDKYWQNESDFSINQAADPRDTSQGKNTRQGMSRYFVEKSPVTSLPFHTSFNVGNGDNYYQDGVIAKVGTFNNRSVQDIMPTYRWILDQSDNELSAFIDYSRAYNGGSSIGLKGTMTEGATTRMDLYASDLALTANNKGIVRHHGNATIDLVLDFTDGTQEVVKGTQTPKGEWIETHFELASLSGKTVKKIAIDITADETIASGLINIGYLGIDDNTDKAVSAVSDVKIVGKNVTDNVSANLRLTWNHDQVNTRQYDIYRVEDGVRYYEGSTANTNLLCRKSTETRDWKTSL